MNKDTSLSKCCSTPVKTVGQPDFIGSNDICTMHMECTKCKQPCDLKTTPTPPNIDDRIDEILELCSCTDPKQCYEKSLHAEEVEQALKKHFSEIQEERDDHWEEKFKNYQRQCINSQLEKDPEKRIWTPDEIPKYLPMRDLVKEWADCGRPSEAIWGVINFLTHFKPEKYSSQSKIEVLEEFKIKIEEEWDLFRKDDDGATFLVIEPKRLIELLDQRITSLKQ